MGTYCLVAKPGDLSQREELRHHEGARMRMGTGSTEIWTVSKSSQTPSKPGGNGSHGVNHPMNLYTFWCLSTLYLLLALPIFLSLTLSLTHIWISSISKNRHSCQDFCFPCHQSTIWSEANKENLNKRKKSYGIHSEYFVDNFIMLCISQKKRTKKI